MKPITPRSHLKLAATALALAALALLPASTQAEESTVEDEIRAMIMADNQYTRDHLMGQEGGNSKHGSLEFWSSGGLMQWVAPDAPAGEFEVFSLTPKHIKVIVLPGGEAAVTLSYSEGSMHPKGGSLVSHYMTRALQVFVKEDGKWVQRAGHWSPIAGGAGTSQTSID